MRSASKFTRMAMGEAQVNGRQMQSRGWVGKGKQGAWGGFEARLGCYDVRTDMGAVWIDVALTPWHFPAQSEPLHVKRQLVDGQVASAAFLRPSAHRGGGCKWCKRRRKWRRRQWHT